MGFRAAILLDSTSPAGVRLTTMEVTFPRFVLAEFNTHRVFCLDGSARLYFDVASEGRLGTRRFTIALSECYDRWTAGGQARDALAAMDLRSCNEDTGEIYHTRIRDAWRSGKKDVFRVTLADGRQIVATKDHLFLTDRGWFRLEDAIDLDYDAGRVLSWGPDAAAFAVNGVPAYADARWLAAQREAGLNESEIAQTANLTMVRHFVAVKDVSYEGVRDTFDIEVEGPYHNFVADGFVVHNSRNSASSRAIPISKMIERVESDPVIPVEWGRNKKGMSAEEEIGEDDRTKALSAWLHGRDEAVRVVRELEERRVHKQVTNRVLEPYLWHTVIVTATEWENFFALRTAPNAQPEIRAVAQLMRAAYEGGEPTPVANGEWHLPLLQDDERTLDIETQKQISAARCARVSYLTHSGRRDIGADIELYERLRADRHLSPFEHVATPSDDSSFHANFRGWIQLRAAIESPAAVRAY